MALFVLGWARASVADPRTVHFAGFAMAESHEQNEALFPVTQELMESDGPLGHQGINAILRQTIASRRFDNIAISDELGDYKRGDALAVACVLTWENVSTESYADFTKLAVNLQAEVLVFDYGTKEVVSAYPFGVEYIDAVHSDIDDQKKREDVAIAYQGPNGLLAGCADALKRVNPKPSFGARMQVVSSEITPSAQAALESVGLSSDSSNELLESAFERYASVNGEIPILPHANSEVIGGVMAARFVNGDIYNFTLPPCDYRVRLTLDNMRKVVVSQTPSESAIAYAGYLTVHIDQPLSGIEYLNASVKFPVVKIIARSGVPDDSAGFQEAILSIADQTTRQFRSYSTGWASKWLVREGAPGQLANVATLLDRCR